MDWIFPVVRIDLYDVGALTVLTGVGYLSHGLAGGAVAAGIVLTFFAATHVLLVRPVRVVEELEEDLLNDPNRDDDEVDE